jgi:hypothetical protein
LRSSAWHIANDSLRRIFGEGEVHRHCGFNLYGLAVQQIRLVLPLLDGFDCRGREHGMSADELDVLHVSRFADEDSQDNAPLDTRLPREGRVDWTYLLNPQALNYALGDAHPRWNCLSGG